MASERHRDRRRRARAKSRVKARTERGNRQYQRVLDQFPPGAALTFRELRQERASQGIDLLAVRAQKKR